jgi:PadR family transcriptional regulator
MEPKRFAWHNPNGPQEIVFAWAPGTSGIPYSFGHGVRRKAIHLASLLQGTLDLLVLKTLQSGPTHGWDIAQRIQQVSQDVLRVGQGSLYPALHRLEAQGWIASKWGSSENDRKAKYYKLTAAGRRQLEAEAETWRLFTGAVERF